MKLDDYKTVLYRQEDGSWVAEIPSISGCYALMPTREEALEYYRKVSAHYELDVRQYEWVKTVLGDDGKFSVTTTDRTGRPLDYRTKKVIVSTGYYDLAKTRLSLARGGIYDASIGAHKMKFQIDAKAKSGPAPVVSRLLRFQ